MAVPKPRREARFSLHLGRIPLHQPSRSGTARPHNREPDNGHLLFKSQGLWHFVMTTPGNGDNS